METITWKNARTVRRYLTVRDELTNSEQPLQAAVVKALLATTPTGYDATETVSTRINGIAEITLAMGHPGYYSGQFLVAELNSVLPGLVGQDIYEVAYTADGSYRDAARLRVAPARFVLQA